MYPVTPLRLLQSTEMKVYVHKQHLKQILTAELITQNNQNIRKTQEMDKGN